MPPWAKQSRTPLTADEREGNYFAYFPLSNPPRLNIGGIKFIVSVENGGLTKVSSYGRLLFSLDAKGRREGEGFHKAFCPS
jgi:hypothetical protein